MEYILGKEYEYITTHWRIRIYSPNVFNNDDYIFIDRTWNKRSFSLKIFKNKIEYYSYNNKGIINNIFDKKIDITITWKSFECCELNINDNIYNIGFIYCNGLTYINSSMELKCDFDIMNFNNEIPRVYGDCFTQLHSYKMFGRALYDNGANYYCYNYTSMPNPNIMFRKIKEDIEKCEPNKVYIFQKSFIKNRIIHKKDNQIKRLMNICNEYPNVKFTTCTVPHVLNLNSVFNTLLLNQNYIDVIDFNKYFENLDNIRSFFIDNSHTNYEGAKLLTKIIQTDAPELCKKYNINYKGGS